MLSFVAVQDKSRLILISFKEIQITRKIGTFLIRFKNKFVLEM